MIAPPVSELGMLKLLTKEDEFSEKFEHLVLRFTDSTYDEIKKAGTGASGGCDNGPLKDSQNAMRHGRPLKHNLEYASWRMCSVPSPAGCLWRLCMASATTTKRFLSSIRKGRGTLWEKKLA